MYKTATMLEYATIDGTFAAARQAYLPVDTMKYTEPAVKFPTICRNR
jgi:hypothetical protein